MHKKSKYFIIFLAILMLFMSVAAATEVDDSTESVTDSVAEESTQDMQVTQADNEKIIKKNTDNKEIKRVTSPTPKTIVVNSENYTTVFGSSGLSADVNDGDIVDVQESFVYNNAILINKAINLTSTTNAVISLNTTSGSYTGNETGHSFTIINSGSYTNITNINFYNTQIFVKNAHHVTMDNINVTVNNQRIGSGVGVFSIRDNSTYVTVKNSYFHTCNNSGSSNIVLAWADYCTIDNNTIIGEGYVGNLFYLTTYNVDGVEYTNVNINAYNNITNNRIYTVNLKSAVCVGVVVSGHNNTFDSNNVSVKSAFAGQWISPYANLTGNFSDTYEGNNYINNIVNGLFTGTKNSTISGNTFLGSVSVPERCKFRYNDASTVTVTFTGPNGCLKGNTIYTLTVKSAAAYTYNCTGNTIQEIGASGPYMKNCTCTECQSTNTISKKSATNVKSSDEVTVVKEWSFVTGVYEEPNWDYVEKTFTYGWLYSNGTLVFDALQKNMFVSWEDTEATWLKRIGETYKVINDVMDEYNVTDVIYNVACDDQYYDFSGLKGVGYDNSLEMYPNLAKINSCTVNYLGHDAEESFYTVRFFDIVPYKNITIINYEGEHTLDPTEFTPILFGRFMGVSPNLKTATFDKFKYTSPYTIIKDMPDVTFINSEITLNTNMTIINSNVTFINSTITIQSDTTNENNSIHLENANLTMINNIINIQNLNQIKLDSNNKIINNTIETNNEYTIEITGSDNQITGNTLTSSINTGDDTILITSGENNIIDNEKRTTTETTIIAPETININEETPITILFKDAEGKLIPNADINIVINDEDPEAVVTDENGIYVYTLTPTTAGTLTFTVEIDKTKTHYENTTTKNITVNEDKDAIIRELNDTINNQTGIIVGQQEQIDALNDTVANQTQTIADQEEVINELNGTVNSQADIIAGQETAINELNGTVNSQADIIAGQEKAIEDLNNAIANQTKSIANQQAQINDLSKQIKDLTAVKDTSIVIDPVNNKVGQKVQITGAVVGEDGLVLADSKVKVSVDGVAQNVTVDAKGTFTVDTKFTTAGNKTVVVTYDGNDKYAASNNSATLNVVKDDVEIIIDDIDSVVYGQKAVITGTLVDSEGKVLYGTAIKANLNGKVFNVKTDKKGVFTITTAAKIMGENSVTLTFVGNNYYNTASSSASFKVLKQDVKVVLDTIDDTAYGDNIVVTGRVTDNDGNALYNTAVKVTINGKTVTVKTDKEGVFTLTSKAVKVGSVSVILNFAGNAYYNACNDSAIGNVVKEDVTVTVDSFSYNQGNFVITGKFTDADGNVMKNSNVLVTLNGKKAYAKTDTNGIFKFNGNTKLKELSYSVGFAGNAYYNAYEGSKTTMTFA